MGIFQLLFVLIPDSWLLILIQKHMGIYGYSLNNFRLYFLHIVFRRSYKIRKIGVFCKHLPGINITCLTNIK